MQVKLHDVCGAQQSELPMTVGLCCSMQRLAFTHIDS